MYSVSPQQVASPVPERLSRDFPLTCQAYGCSTNLYNLRTQALTPLLGDTTLQDFNQGNTSSLQQENHNSLTSVQNTKHSNKTLLNE